MPHIAHWLVCIDDAGAEDIRVLSVYRRVDDDSAEARGFVRVVDESGEDYLYPSASFLPLPLPDSVERELEGAMKRRAAALVV